MAGDNESFTDLYECSYKQSEQTLFYYISLGPAILIAVILSVHKKGNTYPRDVCSWKPSLAIPVNLLDEYTNRWSYAVVFGAITNTVAVILNGSNDSNDAAKLPPAVKVLLRYWWALQASINYFPFFACLYTDHVLLGAIIGTAYSSLWLIMKIVTLVGCADPVPEFIPYYILIEQLPILMCFGFLVLKFTYNGIAYLRGIRMNKSLQKIDDSVAFSFQIEYVKALLKTIPKKQYFSDDHRLHYKIKIYFKKYFYDQECHFKFSTRMICIFMIIFMMIYQLSLESIVMGKALHQLAKDFIESATKDNALPEVIEIIKIWGDIMIESWNISVLLAFALFAFGIICTSSNYRTNLMALHRGDRSFCPPHYKMAASKNVASSMRYAGYQIAFTLGGILLTILTSFFIIWPCYAIFRFNAESIISWLLQVVIFPLSITIGIRITQGLLARYFFLQPDTGQPLDANMQCSFTAVASKCVPRPIAKCLCPHHVSDVEMKLPLALRNRPWYHVADYFFFLANVTVGLFACASRILKGAFVGLFYLGRLDKCVFMRGWETGDQGFVAYMGMLEMEHAHNHPVLRAFCHLLIHKQPIVSTAPQDGSRDLVSEIWVDEGTGPAVPHGTDTCPSGDKPIARRRWLLLYTLLRNPQLIQERRQASGGSNATTTCRFYPAGDSISFDRLAATVNAMKMIKVNQGQKEHNDQALVLNDENINDSINPSFA